MNHFDEITQLLGALALFGNMLISILSYRQSITNTVKIEEVHKATNSMKDQLVATTATASFAAGVKQGEDNPR